VWSTTPVPAIHDKWDVGDYWALQIKNPPEDAAWVKALRATCVEKEVLVKEKWRTGLIWNAKVLFYYYCCYYYYGFILLYLGYTSK
jgi:hypothetical protein